MLNFNFHVIVETRKNINGQSCARINYGKELFLTKANERQVSFHSSAQPPGHQAGMLISVWQLSAEHGYSCPADASSSRHRDRCPGKVSCRTAQR